MMLKHVSQQQRILMPTTNSAYGSGDENNYCTEESPLKPISHTRSTRSPWKKN